MKIQHFMFEDMHPADHPSVNVFIKPTSVFNIYGVTWNLMDENEENDTFTCKHVATVYSLFAAQKFIEDTTKVEMPEYHEYYFEETVSGINN